MVSMVYSYWNDLYLIIMLQINVKGNMSKAIWSDEVLFITPFWPVQILTKIVIQKKS